MTLHHGDCLAILPTLDAESIDAIVTDPPYGLGFMGKSWDHGVPGVPFWEAMLRVAKPGAHLLAFGSEEWTRILANLTPDSSSGISRKALTRAADTWLAWHARKPCPVPR
jgi:DNA modification methylase